MSADFRPLDSLADVQRLLECRSARHAVIGGWAAISWGAIRTTNDIDLLAEIPRGIRKSLTSDLAGLGYDPEWRRGDIDDPIPELLRLSPKDPQMRLPVDILIATRSFERAALDRAVHIELDGWKMPVLRAEDIVALKLRAGGGVDYSDVKAILRVQADKLDGKLLEDSCAENKVLDELRRLRAAL